MVDRVPNQPHNPLEGERPQIRMSLMDGSDEQVSVIIVHKDRPSYLNLCCQSVAVASVNNNYEIIVVDNGSGEESQSFLDDLEANQIKVVRNQKNEFWSAAANKGASLADKNSKYLIFLHCDVTILNPHWMDLLINVSESQGSGMVGVEFNAYAMGNQKVEFIEEYCTLFTKECFKDVGGWDERLPQVGAGFIMTMRAQNAGHKPQVMKNTICHHYRIFSLSINEWERFTDEAMATIPKLISDINSRTVR